MNVKIIQCSFPDIEAARQIGTFLIEKQYAACVKIIQSVESIYFWNGELCKESEVLMQIKTTKRRVKELLAELANLHPYEIPDALVIDVEAGNEEYIKWVQDSVSNT